MMNTAHLWAAALFLFPLAAHAGSASKLSRALKEMCSDAQDGKVGLVPFKGSNVLPWERCVVAKLRESGCQRVVAASSPKKSKRQKLEALITGSSRSITLRDGKGRVRDTFRMAPRSQRLLCKSSPAPEPEENDASDQEETELTDAPVKPRKQRTDSSPDEDMDPPSRDSGEVAQVSSTRSRREPAKNTEQTFMVTGGLGMVSRSFSYQDELQMGTRQYRHTVPAAAAARLSLEVFPLDSVQRAWPVKIRIVGDLETTLGLKTVGAQGFSQETQGLSFSGGLRAQLPLGAGSLHAQTKLGRDGFGVSGPPAERPTGPNVAYTYMEVGLGGGLRFLRNFTLSGTVGYRAVMGAGEINSAMYLPRATASGFAGDVMVGWQVTDSLQVRLAGAMRAYSLAAKPAAGDILTSGSASDRYFSFGPALQLQL